MKDKKMFIEIGLTEEGGIKVDLQGGKLDPIARFMVVMSLEKLKKAFTKEDETICKFIEEHKNE